jgi:hypothetical protein
MAVDPKIKAVWDTYVSEFRNVEGLEPDACLTNERIEAIGHRLQRFTEFELEQAICALWSEHCPKLLDTRTPEDIFWKDAQVRALLDIALVNDLVKPASHYEVTGFYIRLESETEGRVVRTIARDLETRDEAMDVVTAAVTSGRWDLVRIVGYRRDV